MSTAHDADRLPADARIGRVALRVGDLDAILECYRDVVGLAVRSRADDRAVLGTDDASLLVLESTPDAPERGRSEAGLYHVAFRVPSRAALGDALRRVTDRWTLDGASDHGVSEAIYLSDPEGNGVEIYRDYPRDEWPRTPDGGVAMTTDPLDVDGVAGAADGEDAVPPRTDVGHVHLEVTSLDALEDVYVDALGLETMVTVPGAAFVAAGGYHHHVGANVWNRRADSVSEETRGLAWFEVVVPTTDALDAARARLEERGIAVESTTDGFAITDADGIAVRLRASDT